MDLQEDCTHFPAMKQIQGERDVSPRVEFIQKLIGNASDRFDSFSLGQQPVLVLSGEKSHFHWRLNKWADTGYGIESLCCL